MYLSSCRQGSRLASVLRRPSVTVISATARSASQSHSYIHEPSSYVPTGITPLRPHASGVKSHSYKGGFLGRQQERYCSSRGPSPESASSSSGSGSASTAAADKSKTSAGTDGGSSGDSGGGGNKWGSARSVAAGMLLFAGGYFGAQLLRGGSGSDKDGGRKDVRGR